MGRGPVGALDKPGQLRRQDCRQFETDVDGTLKALLEGLVIDTQDGLEGCDEIADHVFRRVVEQCREAPFTGRPGAVAAEKRFHQKRMLGHGEGPIAGGLAVPAGEPRQTVGDVLDLDVERGGIKEVEPTSAQHSLPSAWRRHLPPACLQNLLFTRRFIAPDDAFSESVSDKNSDSPPVPFPIVRHLDWPPRRDLGSPR